MQLAARHPGRVRSLSLHSAWDRTDAYLRTILEMWRSLARGLPTVADAVIQGIFPLCFTPEMYDERPEYAQALADFVRGRPVQPLEAFLSQTEAVLAHDADQVLSEIEAPTLVTFGAHDLVTSTRFADPLRTGIANSELCDLRAPLPRRAARGPRGVQPRHAGLSAAPKRLADWASTTRCRAQNATRSSVLRPAAAVARLRPAWRLDNRPWNPGRRPKARDRRPYGRRSLVTRRRCVRA